ncbi:MAG: DM13 domain-containing protein [Pseudomonadota bacterium]
MPRFAPSAIFATAALFCAITVTIMVTGAAAQSKNGSFRSVGKYSVSGSVKVAISGSTASITLSGFRTTSGPDLYVYVGNGSPSRRIAKLRRNSGTQSYSLPASVAKGISSVHIFCKRFRSTFGTARVR